jgi:transcriptional regulator with XRE-family HTH domain
VNGRGSNRGRSVFSGCRRAAQDASRAISTSEPPATSDCGAPEIGRHVDGVADVPELLVCEIVERGADASAEVARTSQAQLDAGLALEFAEGRAHAQLEQALVGRLVALDLHGAERAEPAERDEETLALDAHARDAGELRPHRDVLLGPARRCAPAQRHGAGASSRAGRAVDADDGVVPNDHDLRRLGLVTDPCGCQDRALRPISSLPLDRGGDAEARNLLPMQHPPEVAPVAPEHAREPPRLHGLDGHPALEADRVGEHRCHTAPNVQRIVLAGNPRVAVQHGFMANEDSRPATRLRALVDQLAAETGRERGWQAEVARRIGVHRSYVSRVAKGSPVSVGRAVVDKVCETLGLDRTFFYNDAKVEPPDYRAYLRERRPDALELTATGDDWERLYWAGMHLLQSVKVGDGGRVIIPHEALKGLHETVSSLSLVEGTTRLADAQKDLGGEQFAEALKLASTAIQWALVWMSVTGTVRPGLAVPRPEQLPEVVRGLELPEYFRSVSSKPDPEKK